MRVWIRNRPDGVTELSPPIRPLEPFDRGMVIATAVIGTAGFFVAGVLPAPVLLTVLVACLAGEVVLATKALVLALLRPVADVHEVPRFAARRRTP
ncbi:MAG TPA: hypothetical protein VFL83_18075 [Anaeromyxobacter sp.]|nr:hypothetical protein [Anaeromyxobacter sp.]